MNPKPESCWTQASRFALLFLLVASMLACETAVKSQLEIQVERLGHGGDAAEEAKNELILAKVVDYDLLLAALTDPDLAASRANLVDVLVRLMERQEEPRILPALRECLRHDPSTEVRVRILVDLGLLEDSELADDFLIALHDEADTVRFQAIQTLTLMRSKLSPNQDDILRERARIMMEEEEGTVQLGVRFLVGDYITDWVEEAHSEALRGRLTEADSLFAHARAYSPTNRKAIFLQARYFYDNGQQSRGLDQLRTHRMLLNVPEFSTAPKLDGRLEEPVWDSAATIDQLYYLAPPENLWVREDSAAMGIGDGHRGDHDTPPGKMDTLRRQAWLNAARMLRAWRNPGRNDSFLDCRRSQCIRKGCDTRRGIRASVRGKPTRS